MNQQPDKICLTNNRILSITDLSRQKIEELFDSAYFFLNTAIQQNSIIDSLKGKVVANLFFEPSTRTNFSFTIAAQRLGAIVLNPNISLTSTVKGESFQDTLSTFGAMGVSAFIIRHPDMNTLLETAQLLPPEFAIINAGAGIEQHPSQALIDLFTISQHKNDFTSLKIAIIGDVAHSRVARSLIQGLQIMGTTKINIVAPPNLFFDRNFKNKNFDIHSNIKEGIADCDVIVTLRIQKERMQDTETPDPKTYFNKYGLTLEHLTLAKKDCIVLHPGPINRGIEIDSAVADGSQSMILQQVRNGVAMRMALLETIL